MSNTSVVHLGKKLDPAVLDSLADIVCGDDGEKYPKYRSSTFLTRFFQDAGINATHDGSTRKWWVLAILEQLHPSDLEKVILRLADLKEYKADINQLKMAVKELNVALIMDGFRVGYENNRPGIMFANPMKLDDETVGSAAVPDENAFLSKQFSDDIKISELKLDVIITDYLQDRVEEAQNCPKGKVSLGTIFLLGSTLEGILLAVALKNPAKFMSATAAPKDKTGKVVKLADWKLAGLIDVSHELGFINLDTKKFSHVLRDFRNYIHPYHQMAQNFKPDRHTVDISWQVFKAAFSQLKAKLK